MAMLTFSTTWGLCIEGDISPRHTNMTRSRYLQWRIPSLNLMITWMYAPLPIQPQHQHTETPALMLIQKAQRVHMREQHRVPPCVSTRLQDPENRFLASGYEDGGTPSTRKIPYNTRCFLIYLPALYFRVLTETSALWFLRRVSLWYAVQGEQSYV